ncbi:uncharacterized protein EV420DRAFT_691640 [Desarmillaria tabescens]|uniref:Uncharacterized protein n=1 Tax=Armillaria tabescens TaxID=1929756 RepID=A0AA39K0F9_ARMTA|nr:uncharacterized protein EV420DRAFT_691640 [Desarmillaria tabescens]KAK0452093.1 hypothetical protein EV420DRAFT_691640 [Desarmillaria tabescens]
MYSFKLAQPLRQLLQSSSCVRHNLSCPHRRYISVFLSNEPGSSKPVKVKHPPLTTLDPRSLSPHDFRDVSNQQVFLFPGVKRTFIHYERKRRSGKSFYIPFPEKTAGYLYYWTHPNLPPTSGQIRFRIMNTSDPQSFNSGRDFCLPSGTPWYISLAYLSGKKSFQGVCDILVRDGLVVRDTIEQLRPFSETVGHMPRQATLLTSPDEIFPLCLPQVTPVIYLAAGKVKRAQRLLFRLKQNEEISKLVEPGKQVLALVKFEFPRKYARNSWYPDFRIVGVYANDRLITTGAPSLIKTHSIYPRSEFVAWCKEFQQT